MMKTLCLVMAPVPSRSGYGDRSRDFVKSLIKTKGEEWDIKIFPTKWGSCPQNALNEKDPADMEIIKRINPGNQLPKKPDVFFQISVPNEFQPIGEVNIGITAGIETDICDSSWLEGCNRMQLVLTSSEHSKRVLENTTYDKMNEQTKEKIGELKLSIPVEVLFEGVDLSIFKKINKFPKTLAIEMKEIPEAFCFLFVGHWLQGDIGHDRKDIGMLIKTFCETFRSARKKPALILKTSGAGFSIMDRDEMLNKIRSITGVDKGYPNVYLLHGDLTSDEMNALYNHPKVKAHVSFTKGEGYGRPLAEAAISGKPLIAPICSGQADFLDPNYTIALPGGLMEIHKSAVWKGVLNQGGKWFYVNHEYASKILKDVYKNYKKYIERGKKLSHHIRTKFSFDNMTERLEEILKEKIAEAPKMVPLKLPKLKKVRTNGVSEASKIKLPKLKKV